MELTRRDALVVLGGVGVAAGGLAVDGESGESAGEDESATPAGTPLSPHDLETCVVLAEVLYPSTVTGIDSFVETYLARLADDRPEHAAAIASAVVALDDFAHRWWHEPYASVTADRRERTLEWMGLQQTEPDPAGTTAQRVQYYLVDELLYALFSSPTGGELLGIENPPGHPGGTASYQRGETRE